MNIYIIAANVSIQLAKLSKNGLIANVGETTRNVRERLKDEDYRRKTPGGGWDVIHEFVEVSVRDRQIHKFLKSHPRVKWNNNSNTEEFTFLDDDGTGSETIKIVSSFLEKHDYGILKRSHSLLKKKYSNLLTEKERLSKLNQQFENSDIHKLIWEVHDEKKRADHAASCLEEGLNRITHARKQFNQEVLRLTREKKQLKTEQEELISSVAKMEETLSEMELSRKRKSKFIYLLSAVLFGSLAYSFLSEEEVKKEVIYRPMVKYVEKVEQPPVVELPKAEKKATAKPKAKKKTQVAKSVKSEKTSALAPKKTTTREQVLRDIKQSQSCGKYDMRYDGKGVPRERGQAFWFQTNRPVPQFGVKVYVVCYAYPWDQPTQGKCKIYNLDYKELSHRVEQDMLNDVTCAWNKR